MNKIARSPFEILEVTVNESSKDELWNGTVFAQITVLDRNPHKHGLHGKTVSVYVKNLDILDAYRDTYIDKMVYALRKALSAQGAR